MAMITLYGSDSRLAYILGAGLPYWSTYSPFSLRCWSISTFLRAALLFVVARSGDRERCWGRLLEQAFDLVPEVIADVLPHFLTEAVLEEALGGVSVVVSQRPSHERVGAQAQRSVEKHPCRVPTAWPWCTSGRRPGSCRSGSGSGCNCRCRSASAAPRRRRGRSRPPGGGWRRGTRAARACPTCRRRGTGKRCGLRCPTRRS